jgi:head-tail adaptor
MPGSPIPTGRRAFHLVRVQNPTPTPAGGDYQETFADAVPVYWFVAIDELAGGGQEQIKSLEGVVLTQPSLTITGAYRADITTASRILDDQGRVLHVISVASPEARQRELVCTCSVITTETAGATR